MPDPKSSVSERVRELAFSPTIDLRDGAILEKDRPYLIPLLEELRLPPTVSARANPKSSTGRLDIFTRVLTDHNARFDDIQAGYRGRMFLEVVPRTFAARVRTGLSLNQIRLTSGDTRLSDAELRETHAEWPLLFVDSKPVEMKALDIADGLFLSADLSSDRDRLVGYRARKNTMPLDLTHLQSYTWRDYWEPVHPERGGRVILEPEAFYLLLSAEAVRIPPEFAAEMVAYDPTAGELRTHYAGFFDPGFGHRFDGVSVGSQAALEVRARDVPFMIEHRQPICRLSFERLASPPDILYGEDAGSNYQGQTTMLSKHFVEQTAGVVQMRIQ